VKYSLEKLNSDDLKIKIIQKTKALCETLIWDKI
jgi:hypothetical protein